MKRDELVKALYSGLIQDMCTTYPGDTRSLKRDLNRLKKNVDKLSHYFYSLEMPRISAAFRLALEYGTITRLHGVNHCTLMRGTVYPRLFYSLWSRVFDGSGDIKSSPDTDAIFFLNEILLIFKKIDGSCDESKDNEVIDEFFKQELAIRSPSLNWNVGDFLPDRDLDLRNVDRIRGHGLTDELFPSTGRTLVDPRLAEKLQQVADVFFASLPEFHPEREQCRHGPGAVSDRSRGTDKYKFLWWPSRLDRLFAYDAHATIGLEDLSYVDHEHPAKLICVPKDARGPRLIASEPSYLQFAQQSFNAFLRKEICNSCISRSIRFKDQSYSQEWAISSSASKSHATVDLKSASDLLSLWLIERLLRRNPSYLSAIYHTRSRYVTNGDNTIHMRKVAPMGNAFIFPLQTVVYTLSCIAALHVIDGKGHPTLKSIRRYAKEVRVFGDDIIIPIRAYGSLVGLLTEIGLAVNFSKSFSQGNFREACGVDAFAGVDVTPAYVKSIPEVGSPESIVSSVEAVNNLLSKGLYHTSESLKSLIPSEYARRIVEVQRGSGAFGFQTFFSGLRPYKKTRFNKSTQTVEVFALTPVSEVKVKRTEGIRNLLQYITERPSPDIVWESGIKVPLPLKLRGRWVPIQQVTGVTTR